MALNNQGKVSNIKASVEKYIADNLLVTEGFDVDFEGVPFEAKGLDEWIQERIIGFPKKEYMRQVSNTLKGGMTDVILSLNIFVDPGKLLISNRIYVIRDIVAGYFKEGTAIPLYDYSEGEWDTVLENLVLRSIVTDSPVPNDTLNQYNYTVNFDWLECY